jgi:hypothetical protein
MTVQTEVAGKMFDELFVTFRKAAEATLRVQQQMFRQWGECWPGFAKTEPGVPEQVQKFQKEWAQALADVTRKYQESWEVQYQNGLKLLEEAFRVPEAHDPEELRQKAEELWRKSFECLRELTQAQLRDFQTAVERWVRVIKPPTA